MPMIPVWGFGVSFGGSYRPNVIAFLACGGTWRCEHTLFCVDIVKRHVLIFIHSFIHSFSQSVSQSVSQSFSHLIVVAKGGFRAGPKPGLFPYRLLFPQPCGTLLTGGTHNRLSPIAAFK